MSYVHPLYTALYIIMQWPANYRRGGPRLRGLLVAELRQSHNNVLTYTHSHTLTAAHLSAGAGVMSRCGVSELRTDARRSKAVAVRRTRTCTRCFASNLTASGAPSSLSRRRRSLLSPSNARGPKAACLGGLLVRAQRARGAGTDDTQLRCARPSSANVARHCPRGATKGPRRPHASHAASTRARGRRGSGAMVGVGGGSGGGAPIGVLAQDGGGEAADRGGARRGARGVRGAGGAPRGGDVALHRHDALRVRHHREHAPVRRLHTRDPPGSLWTPTPSAGHSSASTAHTAAYSAAPSPAFAAAHIQFALSFTRAMSPTHAAVARFVSRLGDGEARDGRGLQQCSGRALAECYRLAAVHAEPVRGARDGDVRDEDPARMRDHRPDSAYLCSQIAAVALELALVHRIIKTTGVWGAIKEVFPDDLSMEQVAAWCIACCVALLTA
ncbi:hypothetical protein GGX14DRAFT_656243 [Mycena pura]|uniref:Uncharacterized protein n=1 Tax=Mycena pura TaxID=153505 RepID=A0AAD6V6T5_9AGAR|nr:hypothetical protein GGX14DRAFT_656243 [Mycena pura]